MGRILPESKCPEESIETQTIMRDSRCRDEYLRRIHAVQDAIETQPDNAPDLTELAEIAGFSKYHFHRIFRAMTGETLWQYVSRVKLERAAAYLAHSPHIPVTDIAYHFGFADSAAFSRSFKNRFGVSPIVFRRQHSKNCKDCVLSPLYTRDARKPEIGRDSMGIQATGVDIAELDLRVIYVRHTGRYQELAAVIPGMIQKLFGFAMGNQLLEAGGTKILSVYHDNPDLTDDALLRTSLCITINKTAKVEPAGDIGVMDIGGQYAVGHFELPIGEYAAAWQHMYGEWLPNSGYQPRDAFPFEVYLSDPSQNPGGNQLLDVCVPVEPMGKI